MNAMDILKRLIRDNPEMSGPQLVMDGSVIMKIHHEITAINKRFAEEEQRHTQAVNDLSKERHKARDACKHELKHYQEDPSGGSDSCYQCDICGATL